MPVIMKDNVQYAYTTKGTVFHTLSNAEYEALSEEEKMNGDVYCIPDREPIINPDQLWEKVGTGTLDIGSDLTDGVNQVYSSLNNLIRQGSITNTSDNNGNVMVSLSGVNIKVILFAWDGLRIYIPFYYNGNWYCRVQTTAATPQAVTNTNLTFQFYYIRG